MPGLGQLAKWLKELRSQQKHEQPGVQIEPRRRAEVQVTQQAQADVDGDCGDRHRAEELEHGGRKEGQAKHGHGAFAKGLDHRAEPVDFLSFTTEAPDGVETAQTIQKNPAEAVQLTLLFAAGPLRAPADENHEKRYQRCGQRQEQAGQPVLPDDGHEKNRCHHQREHCLGQVALIPAFERVHLLDERTGKRTAALMRCVTGAGKCDMPVQPQAQILHDVGGGARGQVAAQRVNECPGAENQQKTSQRNGQRADGLAADHRVVRQAGQQPGLGYGQGSADRRPVGPGRGEGTCFRAPPARPSRTTPRTGRMGSMFRQWLA